MRSGIQHRDLAVFTIVQDEPEFIHPWLNHYKKHVAHPEDVYVLVHHPTRSDGRPMTPDEMPEWRRAEELIAGHHRAAIVPVHNTAAFDHRWLAATVSRFQSFLLQSYAWVLFAEADEFVLRTPDANSQSGTLCDFVGALGMDAPLAVRASGFEVVQQSGEPPVAAARFEGGSNIALTAGELIDSRHWWHRSANYSKTLLARTALTWQIGFHAVEGTGQEIAAGEPSNLVTLVHLHKVDFDLALQRMRRSRARKWSQADVEQRLGWQNRLETETELRTFWEQDHDTGQPMAPSRLSRIPPEIKQALR